MSHLGKLYQSIWRSAQVDGPGVAKRTPVGLCLLSADISGCSLGTDHRLGSVGAPRLHQLVRIAAVHDRGLRKSQARVIGSWRRKAATALAAYAVVGVFGVAFLFVRLVWTDASDRTALIVATFASAPLAVALIWERLGAIKMFGVEVTLSDVAVPVDQSLATALSQQQYFSGAVAIFQLIERAIQNPALELVEINLRSTPYWWSTRLFLQAALVEDFSTVRRLVFVTNDEERRYVGMATPTTVKKALAQQTPGLLRLYQRIRDNNPAQTSGQSEVQRIVESWSASQFFVGERSTTEDQAMTRVTAEILVRWVPVEREAVEWDQPLDSAFLQYLVLERGTHFVALTRNGRLERVVNADTLARRMASRVLQARFH